MTMTMRGMMIRSVARLLALCVLIVLLAGCDHNHSVPLAEEGLLDLTTWDYSSRGPVRLEGEWMQRWGELLSPEDFPGSGASLVRLPMLWGGEGRPETPKGIATYGLKVLPGSLGQRGALLIETPLSAVKVWINGMPRGESGSLGKTALEEEPRRHGLLVCFSQGEGPVDIVIQLSNHTNVVGGLNSPIWFGREDQLSLMRKRSGTLAAVFGGAFFLLALFHLSFYSIRRSERVNLYFGLYCLMWSLSTIFGNAGGCLMDSLIPGLPWRLTIDLSLIPYGISVPLLVMFYHVLFPHRFSAFIDGLYLSLGAAFVLTILLAEPNAFGSAPKLYRLVTLSTVPYLGYRFARDLIGKRPGVALLAPGYLVLGVSGAADLFFDFHLVSDRSLSLMSSFVFIFSYSFLITARFSKAFATVEALNVELEEKNQALTRLDRLKDEFLANTTHELKTPLNGIIGISESLKNGVAGPLTESAQSNLSLIVSSGRRLSGLINDILDVSLLRKREVRLNPRPISLRPLVDRVLPLAASQLKGGGLHLENKVDEALSQARADENRVIQILHNLVGNAVKFTPEGRITVKAREVEGWIEVAVCDSGVGIPEARLDSIFDPFVQGDGSIGRSQGGAGLGLSITRDLVTLHGGQIRVVSQPGEGSCFTFTLPKATEKQDAHCTSNVLETPFVHMDLESTGAVAAPVLPSVGVGTGRCPRILAVDDDPVNLQVVVNALSLEGMEVHATSSGTECLAWMESNGKPDLLLLDIMMPGLSGYEVCREVRGHHAPAELPVILLTAKNRTEDLLEGFHSGATDYLTKPFASEELLARVRLHLQLEEAHRTLKENLSLRKELAQRVETEEELKLTQSRLTGMLNTLKMPLLAINENHEVCYYNRSFEAIYDVPASSLLGRFWLDLIEPSARSDAQVSLEAWFSGGLEASAEAIGPVAFLKPGLPPFTRQVSALRLELDDELLALLVLDENGATHEATQMVAALNQHQQRLSILTDALDSMGVEVLTGAGVSALEFESLERTMRRIRDQLQGETGGDLCHLVCETMRFSLALWTESTGTTKVEMARKSGLWKVYTDKDGWDRTQTLDKYLKTETVPARPRVGQVVRTAEFVLATCTGPEHLKTSLNRQVSTLKTLGTSAAA